MMVSSKATGLPVQPSSGRVRVVAWGMAVWCLAFAVVNVVYEVSGHFERGAYGEYATGISIMSWLVVALKVLGAVVALLTVTRRWPAISVNLRTVAVWGAFALLGVYSAGNVAFSIGLASGLTDSREQITASGIGYVVFFLAGAVGYGVLAVSFSRRCDSPRKYVVLGIIAAPLVLGAVLLAIPAALAALGLLPNP